MFQLLDDEMVAEKLRTNYTADLWFVDEKFVKKQFGNLEICGDKEPYVPFFNIPVTILIALSIPWWKIPIRQCGPF